MEPEVKPPDQLMLKRTLKPRDLWENENNDTPIEPYTKKRKLKPSKLPAIELPDPGQSYNPVIKQYHKLLSRAAREFLRQETKIRRINRALKAEKILDWDPTKEYDEGFFEYKIDDHPLEVLMGTSPEYEVSSHTESIPNPSEANQIIPKNSKRKGKKRKSRGILKQNSDQSKEDILQPESESEIPRPGTKIDSGNNISTNSDNAVEISENPEIKIDINSGNPVENFDSTLQNGLSETLTTPRSENTIPSENPGTNPEPESQALYSETHIQDSGTDPENLPEFSPELPFPENYYETHKVKKSQTERNKERKKRVNRSLERRKRAKIARKKALNYIDEINAKLDKLYKKRAKRSEKRKEIRRYFDTYGTKRLGSEKFERSPVELLLPKELPSRLSLMANYKSNMKDRFQSLRQRNIIETRYNKLILRKYRRKYVERYDYKVYNREQEQKYANLGKEKQ